MALGKICISCLTVLILANFTFYMMGYNSSVLSATALIGEFVTIAIIGVLISLLPTTSGAGAVRWLLSTLIIVTIVFSWNIDLSAIPTFGSYPLGFGLGSNLIGMFSASTDSLEFLPFIFFTLISLMAVVSGIFALGGSSD